MDVVGNINCITTDCGHIFHANCLMKNIDRNGFRCPCCRSQMVEEREESDSDESEYDSDNESESWIEEADDEYALRGLRFFTNLLEGHEHDQLDIVEEFQYEDSESEEDEERQLPSIEFVAGKLREQGVTFEQLIAWTLIDHTKYVLEQSDNDEKMLELENYSGDIYGKFKTIIHDFNMDQVD